MTIGGIPVKIASNGRGMAVTIAANGRGIPATKVSSALGVPIREVAKGGIPIVYVGGSSGDLLAGLSWTAGANTTLSTGGGFARSTATTTGAPRIFKGSFPLISGKVYQFGGNAYVRTASGGNVFFRVSSLPDISVGDIYNFSQASGTLSLNGVSFTSSFTGQAYLGIVSLVSAAGEYSEIDNNFSLVML